MGSTRGGGENYGERWVEKRTVVGVKTVAQFSHQSQVREKEEQSAPLFPPGQNIFLAFSVRKMLSFKKNENLRNYVRTKWQILTLLGFFLKCFIFCQIAITNPFLDTHLIQPKNRLTDILLNDGS